MINGSRQSSSESGTWAFYNPVHIVFGPDSLNALPGFCADGPVLLVTTPGFTRRGVTDRVVRLLGERSVSIYDHVQPNPDLSSIEAIVRQQKNEHPRTIVGLGGGSALDTAKAVACLMHIPDNRDDWREVLTAGSAGPDSSVPVIAVPTTAGTGAEVTPFATLWDAGEHKKYSLAGPAVFPRVAIVDPCLTLSLPEEETVSTGLDALSQGLESIWNRHANPVSMAYAEQSVQIAIRVLRKLVHYPNDLALRSEMMKASLFAGLAISSTRTALAHSISYPLTSYYGIPHGLACSFTLPEVCAYNAEVDDGRLSGLSHYLGLTSIAVLVDELSAVLEELNVGRRLQMYVSAIEDVMRLRDKMITPERAANNMRGVTDDSLEFIVLAACRRLRFTAAVLADDAVKS